MRDYIQKQLSPQTWLDRLSPQQLAGIVLGLFVLSGFLFLLDRNRNLNIVYEPLPSPDFSLIQRFEDVELVSAPQIVGDTAVFAGSLTPDELPILISLNLETGQPRWTVDINEQSKPGWWVEDIPWNFPLRWQWGPVAVNDSSVFVADRFLLTTSVTAYDLATSERLWQRQIGLINGSQIRRLFVTDEQLAVQLVEPTYSELNILDVDSGYELFRENENGVGLFWVDQFEESNREYRAYSDETPTTHANSLTLQLDSCGLTPHVQETRIVVHALLCDGSGHGGIVALNRETGDTLWRLDVPVASQIGLDGAYGYVVSHDNQLLAIDLERGEVLSILRFDKPLRRLSNETPIFIGAGDGKTAVYFAATRQLFFFESVYQNVSEGD